MGRRKQSRPHRSGGVTIDAIQADLSIQQANNDASSSVKSSAVAEPHYVEIDRSSWISNEHLDISEIVISNLIISEEFSGLRIDEKFLKDSRFFFRLRVSDIDNTVLDRMKLGHWPAISPNDIYLELVEKQSLDGTEKESLILSGKFDGPSDGVTAIVHLVSMQFVTVRPLMGIELDGNMISLRLRVELMKSAFDACGSLLESDRKIWKKSMLSMMGWLRPEVLASEMRYGIAMPETMVAETSGNNETNFQQPTDLNVFEFYEAIKPERSSSPLLEDDFPDLRVTLRPYQRRAAYWMVQKEKEYIKAPSSGDASQLLHPFSVPLSFLDSSSNFYYNPFSGSVSMSPELVWTKTSGGILADEMGLGKTIELLACITTHKFDESENESPMLEDDNKASNFKRLRKERVECICGAVSENRKYDGLWVQCDVCNAWQHASCVGYHPKGNKRTIKREKKRRKTDPNIFERDGEFICSTCSDLLKSTDRPIVSGATLIVCPVPILQQWHSEIKRHTLPGSLKVLVYDGVRDLSLSDTAVVEINEFLSADVVLTTYDVLKDDLSHDSDRHDGDRRFLRFQKRYPVTPTILTRILWWRLCLDEAQMVEANAAAATEMALRLSAKHRWCITGTPIQRKLNDLFGLLKFLKASPFDVFRWWNDVIREPYEKGDKIAIRYTHMFFKQVMWRSCKTHVADELQLPTQHEQISWLKFSAIEEHFYHRQHETCETYAREVIENLKADLLARHKSASSDQIITHTQASKLLNSLLKLRQACCHPQVGSSGLRSLQQTPMTMDEILMVLISKTKSEGEEALRMMVIALNALAGIAIIQEKFQLAVDLYREALTTSEEHAEDFRLDPLVNIHIHHNLAEILPLVQDSTVSISDVSNSENNGEIHKFSKFFDENLLKSTCQSMKQKYLSVFISRLSSSRMDFEKINEVCCEYNNQDEQKKIWWLTVLHHVEQNKDSSKELLEKINEGISGLQDSTSSTKITSRFRSITALKYNIQTRLDGLNSSRETLLNRLLEVDQTMENPLMEDLARISSCRICRKADDGPLCVHCEMDEIFQLYEASLFRITKRKGELVTSVEEAIDLQKKDSELNRFYNHLSQPKRGSVDSNNEESRRRDVRDRVVVSKSPSELEVVFGVMKSFAKSILGKDDMKAANEQLHFFEALRKEYESARSLAVNQAQLLNAHDEIKMATSRLTLKRNELDNSIDFLSLDELDSASVLHSNDKFAALASFLRIKGKLRYLQRLMLSKQSGASEAADNSTLNVATLEKASDDDNTCPVCQEKLGNQKMVFQCGHLTCCKCFVAITERGPETKAPLKWAMCPTCRQHSDIPNIAYVDDKKPSGPSEHNIQVQGSYGTKIEAVIRTILTIKQSNPASKILVFSTWNDVLDVLEHSFKTNAVTFVRMKGGRKSQSAIREFRHGDKQVLLLLIHHGANGLNLLEAQHVILVEPLLNPAAEAQAINRVHRLGQTDETVVHRFIVKGTVEEGIFKINRSRDLREFAGKNKKNEDRPILTLDDVEALFGKPGSQDSRGLMDFPPSVAAAIAAERRLVSHLDG